MLIACPIPKKSPIGACTDGWSLSSQYMVTTIFLRQLRSQSGALRSVVQMCVITPAPRSVAIVTV